MYVNPQLIDTLYGGDGIPPRAGYANAVLHELGHAAMADGEEREHVADRTSVMRATFQANNAPSFFEWLSPVWGRQETKDHLKERMRRHVR